LVVEHGTGIRIDQPTGFDGGDLSESQAGPESNAEKANKVSAQVVTSSVKQKADSSHLLGMTKNGKAWLDGRGGPSSTNNDF
jgi:hypothetical protein